MMAALANSTQTPPANIAPGPPQGSGTPQPNDLPQPHANPPSNAPPPAANAQTSVAQGATRGAQSSAEVSQEMVSAGERTGGRAHAGGLGVASSRDANASRGADLAKQQEGAYGTSQPSWPVDSAERQPPPPTADAPEPERNARRRGSLHHPTRPHAAHFRPALAPPVQPVAGGLRNLQPKPERPAANPLPEQCPPFGRPGAPRQQRKVAGAPASGSRQPPPPQLNARAPPVPLPSQSGTTRTGNESGRDLGGQPPTRHTQAPRAEAGDARAVKNGHVAPFGQPPAAPPAERSAAQTVASRRSASPAAAPRQEAQQPVEQPPPPPAAPSLPPRFRSDALHGRVPWYDGDAPVLVPPPNVHAECSSTFGGELATAPTRPVSVPRLCLRSAW